MKDRLTSGLCMLSFLTNISLFVAKLYVGLASNSISIYSDGINNFFDSLSGIISFLCLIVLMKSAHLWGRSIIEKAEQLLSFIMAVFVSIAAVYFAYSSLERLMYPTPVNFYLRYLWVLVFTALVKLVLFLIFRFAGKGKASPVIRVMAYDSLLDFFITSVTVMTLLISAYGSYSFDAICGFAISIVIIVSAVKMIIEQVRKLIGYVSPEIRAEIEKRILENECVAKIESISFVYHQDIPVAYIMLQLKFESDYQSVKARLEELFDENKVRVTGVI